MNGFQGLRRVASLAALLIAAALVAGCGKSGEETGSASAGAEGGGAAAGNGPGAATTGKPLVDRIKSGEDAAVKFLRKHQDPKTGAVHLGLPRDRFPAHPGITALVLSGYLGCHRGYGVEDGPFVRNALEYLAGLQKEDGAIYDQGSANYVTSLAVLALVASGEEKYRPVVERARDWLVRLQAAEDAGYRKEDRFYGGVGYGGDERPDLSNTQFAIEAVHAAGLEEDHPFYEAALVYLQRSQNLSEVNDQVWKDAEGNEVRPGNDGGAIYAPGESKAGIATLEDGGRVFISYGSMSYALLKSYIFCGLDRRDRRVRAVAEWCRDNFELEKHPGFRRGKTGTEEYQGLFYYYMTLARTLGVIGDAVFEDEAGVVRRWAEELAETLLAHQAPDGSFVNARNGRWQEEFPVLCTGYALLALEECRKVILASETK